MGWPTNVLNINLDDIKTHDRKLSPHPHVTRELCYVKLCGATGCQRSRGHWDHWWLTLTYFQLPLWSWGSCSCAQTYKVSQVIRTTLTHQSEVLIDSCCHVWLVGAMKWFNWMTALPWTYKSLMAKPYFINGHDEGNCSLAKTYQVTQVIRTTLTHQYGDPIDSFMNGSNLIAAATECNHSPSEIVRTLLGPQDGQLRQPSITLRHPYKIIRHLNQIWLSLQVCDKI